MAYAHANIEIKPVSGIDFKPAPLVQALNEAPPVPRPPSLTPEAAQKLSAIANDLQATLAALPPEAAEQASIKTPNPMQGL
jgi:hypothetical protein